MKKISLSVVIPVYGAPDILPHIYERLVGALSSWADFELILVNDACPMGSGKIIAELAARDQRVKFIDFSRNFGQHIAISAGMHHSSGDYAVVMDCDLQDPPEEIKNLFEKLNEGYEVVFGVRQNRQDGWIKKTASKCFHRVRDFLIDTKGLALNDGHANFSILTKKVINGYKLFKEVNRSYPDIVKWMGYSIGFLNVVHSKRESGKSSYNFIKSLKLAFSLIMFSSNKPLVISVYCALGIFLGTFVFGLRLLYKYFVYGVPVEGWTSLMLTILFFSGLQLLFMGLLGAYIGGIFTENKGRPLYVIARTMNLDEDE